MPRYAGGVVVSDAAEARIANQLESIIKAQEIYGPDALISMVGGSTSGIASSISSMGEQISRGLTGQLKAIAKAFEDQFADGERRAEMFRLLGAKGQDSVLRSYDQRVTAREGPASASHYRAGQDRLAGGVLRRALASPKFFSAGPNGLNFINVAQLDEEARHWHRLAFGAGSVGQGSNARFTVTLNGLTAAAFGFDEGPSPAFTMPPGVFLDPATGSSVPYNPAHGRGADEFYTVGRGQSGGKYIQTKGIQGKPFLEAGLYKIAKELPIALNGYYKEIVREAKAGSGYGADLAREVHISARFKTPTARVI